MGGATGVAAIAQGWILQQPRGWAGWGVRVSLPPFPTPHPWTASGWGTHPDQGLHWGWVMLGVGGMEAGGVSGGSQHPRWGGGGRMGERPLPLPRADPSVVVGGRGHTQRNNATPLPSPRAPRNHLAQAPATPAHRPQPPARCGGGSAGQIGRWEVVEIKEATRPTAPPPTHPAPSYTHRNWPNPPASRCPRRLPPWRGDAGRCGRMRGGEAAATRVSGGRGAGVGAVGSVWHRSAPLAAAGRARNRLK